MKTYTFKFKNPRGATEGIGVLTLQFRAADRDAARRGAKQHVWVTLKKSHYVCLEDAMSMATDPEFTEVKS